MGANQHCTSTRSRCASLQDIVDQLQGLEGCTLNGADFIGLTTDALHMHACLRRINRQQLELLEALEMMLTMLGADPDQLLRSAGVMHLLVPLVEKLSSSIGVLNAAIH